MRAGGRPLTVSVVGWLYIAVGAIGFAYHVTDIGSTPARETFGIEATEAVAIVAGVFLLRGQSWARWLAIAWMGFHVGLSAFRVWRETLVHAIVLGAIAWCLWCAPAQMYFARQGG